MRKAGFGSDGLRTTPNEIGRHTGILTFNLTVSRDTRSAKWMLCDSEKPSYLTDTLSDQQVVIPSVLGEEYIDGLRSDNAGEGSKHSNMSSHNHFIDVERVTR